MLLLTFYTLFISITNLCFATFDCSQVEQVEVTFYGWTDNSPPGPAISCALDSRGNCNTVNSICTATTTNSDPISTPTSSSSCGPRGETAGGIGTYDDPLTMASAAQWFCNLEVVYLPYLQKYLRYEDYCQECVQDIPKGIHIDIWTGSNTTSGGSLQLQCEDTLTPTSLQSMIRNPPSNLTVDTSTLFIPNGKSAICNGTRIYQTSDARKFYLVPMKIWLTCTLLFLLLQIYLFY